MAYTTTINYLFKKKADATGFLKNIRTHLKNLSKEVLFNEKYAGERYGGRYDNIEMGILSNKNLTGGNLGIKYPYTIQLDIETDEDILTAAESTFKTDFKPEETSIKIVPQSIKAIAQLDKWDKKLDGAIQQTKNMLEEKNDTKKDPKIKQPPKPKRKPFNFGGIAQKWFKNIPRKKNKKDSQKMLINELKKVQANNNKKPPKKIPQKKSPKSSNAAQKWISDSRIKDKSIKKFLEKKLKSNKSPPTPTLNG